MNNANTLAELSNQSIISCPEGLWERFCKGNREALGIIYHGHIDDLYNYGMHFCSDAEKVKDCIQDLFQCLWLDREHISIDVQNIRYYLISSLRRRLLRSLEKSRRNYMEAPGDSFDFEVIPPREDIIIQDEIYHQKATQLLEGICSLSRRQREAIYLRFYYGLSYAEISKLMSMKVESKKE